MAEKPEISILMVCLGNICRSPLAEGVLRAVVEARGEGARYRIDSAGTGAWHVGSAPDRRSIAVARQHGIDISGQACRQVTTADFEAFDLILGMDMSNVEHLRAMAPGGSQDRVHLFIDFAEARNVEVPDPYHGGANGFSAVYRMIHGASERLAEKLADRPASTGASGHASSTT